jgi:transcriptional regulator with XRE-family HTH domain
MSAIIERSVLVGRAQELEAELSDASAALAPSSRTPKDLVARVKGWIKLVEDNAMPPPVDIDLYFLLALQSAALRAQDALSKTDPERRHALRICLEQWRQVFRDIAEGDPISEERKANELSAWILTTLGVPMGQIASLVGVSPRSYQRWVSSESSPRPDEERRLRLIAHVASNLRHMMTGPGVVQWFAQPRRELKGRRPLDLLDDPSDAPRLIMMAASARSIRGT